MLRLYTIEGCPHCEKARDFLAKHNIPHEKLDPKNDPIISQGLAVTFPGVPPQFPILINFGKSSITVGFQEREYEQLAEFYRSNISASVSNGSSTEQLSTGATEELVPEETS
jgi:glutaredoxin